MMPVLLEGLGEPADARIDGVDARAVKPGGESAAATPLQQREGRISGRDVRV